MPDDDDPGPFRHGVASFDPGPDRVLIWTRVSAPDGSPSTGPVAWRVTDGPAGARVLASGSVEPDPGADGTVTVEVTGLPPGAPAWYRFEHGGVRSPVGRTRTLPVGPTGRVRLAVVCCSDLAKGPLDVYRHVARRDVDLVVHLGDYLYADTAGSEHPLPPEGDAVTLDDYRVRYGAHRLDGDVRALHQAHPVVAIWDDHDLADNAWRGGAAGHDPETQGPWAERAAAALRARTEWLPARLAPDVPPDRLWRSFELGDLVELVVTDARWWGRVADPTEGDPDDADRDLLGEDQWRWLEERLRARRARWGLVTSQVVVNDLRLPLPGGGALDRWLPSGFRHHGEHLVRVDQWDGFPASRRRLAAALADAGDVALLSGDIHASMAFEGPPGPSGRPVAVEWVCPPVMSTPMGRMLPAGTGVLAELLAPEVAERLRWADLNRYGFLLVDVEPQRARAGWWAVEPGTEQDEPEPMGAFEVRAGQPGRLHPVPEPELDEVAAARRPEEPPLPEPTVPARRPRRWRRRLGRAGAAAVAALAGVALVRSRPGRAARRWLSRG